MNRLTDRQCFYGLLQQNWEYLNDGFRIVGTSEYSAPFLLLPSRTLLSLVSTPMLPYPRFTSPNRSATR